MSVSTHSMDWWQINGGSPPPPSDWILLTGFWSDTGIWDDAATWND